MPLQQFDKDPLYSEPLSYWYDQWISFTSKVKNNEIGIEIVNIRWILLDVIKEYELNNFKSENNRKVYLHLIENLMSDKYMKAFRDELFVLKEKIEEKDGHAAYIIAKEISSKIGNGNFAQNLFDKLFKIFESKNFTKKTQNEIDHLTRDIIIDLVTSGRDIDDVKNLVVDAFNTYSFFHGKFLIQYKDIPSDISTEEEKSYVDNLKIEDRLKKFRENLSMKKYNFLFIFPVWGMITPPHEDHENSIFNLDIYDPTFQKRLGDDKSYDETFNTERYKEDGGKTAAISKFNSRCNVAIEIKAVSRKTAKKLAEEKYHIFLNLANLKFANQNNELFWDGQFIGKEIDTKSRVFGTLFGADEDAHRKVLSKNNPIPFSREKYLQIGQYSKVIDLLTERKMFIEVNSIIGAIELISKSIWDTDENKLLNYWICLESLANISKPEKESKFDFIKSTISNMFFTNEQYVPVNNLFSTIFSYTFEFSFKNDNSINIPKDFLEDIGIYKARVENTTIPLLKLYNRMDELKKYVTNESLISEIEDTREFYNDNSKALKIMLEKKNKVSLTIDYIYKSRNQIVHNGYVARNLIPFLVEFAKGYALSLFQRIIDAYLSGEYDLPSYFIKEQFDGELLERKLSSKEHYEIDFR